MALPHAAIFCAQEYFVAVGLPHKWPFVESMTYTCGAALPSELQNAGRWTRPADDRKKYSKLQLLHSLYPFLNILTNYL